MAYLTANDWELINSKVHRRTFRLGETIIHQGNGGDRIYFIRKGEASVEIAFTSKRAALARLGPDDICGDMAYLEKGKATAAVIASDDVVEADEILTRDLQEIFEAFPRLASRFYRSLAVVLAQRLRHTSRELAREMADSDRKTNHQSS